MDITNDLIWNTKTVAQINIEKWEKAKQCGRPLKSNLKGETLTLTLPSFCVGILLSQSLWWLQILSRWHVKQETIFLTSDLIDRKATLTSEALTLPLPQTWGLFLGSRAVNGLRTGNRVQQTNRKGPFSGTVWDKRHDKFSFLSHRAGWRWRYEHVRFRRLYAPLKKQTKTNVFIHLLPTPAMPKCI